MKNSKFNGGVYDDLDVPETREEYDEKEEYVKENFDRKLASLGHGVRFAKHLVALFRFMGDGIVPWYRKTLVVAALVYFLVPFDAIPDMLPLVGYFDDFGVIAAVLAYLGKELSPYYVSTVGFGSYDDVSG